LGQAEAAGSVLAVGDREVDVVLFPDQGQMRGEDLTAG